MGASLRVSRSALRRIGAGAALGALGIWVGLVPSGAAAGPQTTPTLSKEDRAIVVQARQNNVPDVNLLIAARAGASQQVADAVTALGGNVRVREASIDYVRALVPTSQVDAVAGLSGVQAVSPDVLVPMEDPRPEAGAAEATPTPPGPGTAAENSQLPTRDIGAPQFVGAHPSFDGRGVVIGILDAGIDVLTPELQTAKKLDGTPTRKIIDWQNFNDPLTGLDPSWVNMAAQVTVAGGSVTVDGVTYTGAADGQYRFGVFDESSIAAGSEYAIACGAGRVAADLNRNGVCGERFAVLWNTSQDTVQVDANADHSFAGEPVMRNYAVNFDIGLFGTDNPGTPTRETVPFTIQTDGKDKFVNIGVVGSEHATHVAGIAAGKSFFGGAMNGAAPEAQIVSVRGCVFGSACTAAALIDGMVFLEKQANVDVINMSIGGLPALNDGNNARAILYNRLIDQSNAQMFISAGNSGPGHNTVGDPAVASKVVSVGAYVHRDTWFNDYGAIAAKDDGLFPFTSRGPREDGGLKPNIVAPGAAISTVPAWEPTFPLVGPLPPGYDLLNGTSMAAPQATGGAALLISAAKQTGAQVKPDQLRQAIMSSARYLPAEDAYEQGAGIFQVGAAWDLLKANIRTVEITSAAPVATVLSGRLATPNQGVGIYEREGWAPGQTGTRVITFTRTNGGSQPVTYALTWVGNDGTFSSAGSIILPRGTAVALPVGISAAAAGIHSALLRLDDPATVGIDYQVMNTIVAANQFTPANNFSVSTPGQADRPDMAAFVFNVPASTPSLRVDVTGINGRIRVWRNSPQGLPIDTPSFQTGGTQTLTLANPMAGVWEVDAEVSRTSAASPATFTVTATIQGVDVSPASQVVDPAAVGTGYSQSYTFTNRFGAFTGGSVGTSLGTAFSARPSISAGGADQVYAVNVPAGSTSISARIGNPSDPAADLDLILFDCHTGTCVQAAAGTGSTATESVSVGSPAAGAWRVVVNAFAVPTGSTAYDVFDVVANTAFGSVTVSDPPALHASGSSWTAVATAVAAAAPDSGRFLQGFVQVRSGSIVLGSSEVQLRNVG
jgi:Subtilase family